MEIELGKAGFRFERRPEFLLVEVWGPTESVELKLGLVRKIVEECCQCHYKRVLIVEDLATNLSPMQTYATATAAADLGLRGLKIALVDLNPEHHEVNLFGETVAVNRGISLKCFRSVAAGEGWLLAEKENGRAPALSFRPAPEAVS